MTWSASRSASEKTATVRMPRSRQARITRTAISPRLATRTFLRLTRSLLDRLHRRLEEARVHDVLERHHRLHEPVRLPPRHLLGDVLDEETPLAVLVREAAAHDVGRAARVLHGDGDHLVVV